MSELEYKVEGILVQDHTLVSDKDMQHSLEQRGFGDVIRNKFMLEPFESLYLLYIDKLNLVKVKQQVDFDNLLDECIKHDQDIFTKFLIYRELRTRGYIAKDGFSFDAAFSVCKSGLFEEMRAKNMILD